MHSRQLLSISPWAFAATVALSLLGTGAATADDDFVDVCVDEDRVMRIRDAGAMHCQGGERELRLSVWQPEEPEEEPAEDEQEDKAAETTRIKAPFEVVDKQGTVILRVNDDEGDQARGLQILSGGQAVVAIGAPADGGRIQLLRGGTPVVEIEGFDGGGLSLGRHGGPQVAVAAADNGAFLVGNMSPENNAFMLTASPGGEPSLTFSHDDGTTSVELGASDGRTTALRFNNAEGKQLAAIGIDRLGDGAVYANSSGHDGGVEIQGNSEGAAVLVKDSGGMPRATVSVSSAGKGVVNIISADTIETVAALTEGENGGQLQIANNGGTPMVEAGVIPSGVGVVRTGPGGSLQTSMTIPSFIMGKVAGQ